MSQTTMALVWPSNEWIRSFELAWEPKLGGTLCDRSMCDSVSLNIRNIVALVRLVADEIWYLPALFVARAYSTCVASLLPDGWARNLADSAFGAWATVWWHLHGHPVSIDDNICMAIGIATLCSCFVWFGSNDPRCGSTCVATVGRYLVSFSWFVGPRFWHFVWLACELGQDGTCVSIQCFKFVCRLKIDGSCGFREIWLLALCMGRDVIALAWPSWIGFDFCDFICELRLGWTRKWFCRFGLGAKAFDSACVAVNIQSLTAFIWHHKHLVFEVGVWAEAKALVAVWLLVWRVG